MFGRHKQPSKPLAQAANAHHRHKQGRTGRFHGDDLLEPDFEPTPDVGDVDAVDLHAFGHLQSSYGEGDTGRGFRPMLMRGGEDPFANAMQPGDPGDYPQTDPLPHRRVDTYDGAADPAGMLDDYADDLSEAYQPVGPDTWNFPEQIPTLRNPHTDFGGEFYSFQGPAAVIGAEIGCAAPGGAKLKG